VRVAEEAAAGLQTSSGGLDAARWLDAEDATMGQVLAWAMGHEPAIGLRLVVALGWWWYLRGRLMSQYPLLSEAVGFAEVGSDEWCSAQYWLGSASLHLADPARALGHFTTVRDAVGDRAPSRALADCLVGRSHTFLNMGRIAEAADEGCRSLALARELRYPLGETLALGYLSVAASYAGDLDTAVQLARQAAHIPAGIPGWVAGWCRSVLTVALTDAGDPAAESICAEGLAQSREAGDLRNLAALLAQITILDLQAGRIDDAAAHLRESLQIALRAGDQAWLLNGLDCCGHLCAATGRWTEALTVWAAHAVLLRQEGFADWPADEGRRDEPLRKARQALGLTEAQAAEERGAAMSLAIAAEYALMLTAQVPQPPAAAAGPAQLSARERELVTLVAQGRTNAQIAAQLYISVRTVGSHLDRIRDKTGCRRRADLTRLALTVGLV
jgi:DNA-binding CsgD family transcriptional regulator